MPLLLVRRTVDIKRRANAGGETASRYPRYPKPVKQDAEERSRERDDSSILRHILLAAGAEHAEG